MSDTGRPTLTVVGISRNEIRDIKGFIENVGQIADEIVIVDDGSTDGTVEYLRNCGMPVVVVERRIEPDGGFAAQRNVGIDTATSAWVLNMDIDERLTPQLAASIRAAVSDGRFDAYRYRRLNFFLHRPFNAGGWAGWNRPQLGRRGRHRFTKPIHEEVVVEGGASSIGQLDGWMWHLNDESFVERINKNAGYAALTARELVKRGRRVRWWHLLLIPLARALKAYFAKGAWRHGEHGLIFALYTFGGTFNWYAVAWDEQNRISRDDIEADLRGQWRRETTT